MSEEREPLQDVRPDTLVCAYYGEEASWHRGLAERTFERKGKKLVSQCNQLHVHVHVADQVNM